MPSTELKQPGSKTIMKSTTCSTNLKTLRLSIRFKPQVCIIHFHLVTIFFLLTIYIFPVILMAVSQLESLRGGWQKALYQTTTSTFFMSSNLLNLFICHYWSFSSANLCFNQISYQGHNQSQSKGNWLIYIVDATSKKLTHNYLVLQLEILVLYLQKQHNEQVSICSLCKACILSEIGDLLSK